ncbi:MAG: hypothetical protein ACOYZ6_07895 [Chloroflexota bacterium]
MQLEELQAILQHLNRFQLTLILWYVRARWILYKVGLLQPVHVLFPATILQIIILVCATSLLDQFIYIFAIGNFIVVWLAVLPSMLQPRPIRAHWVS